MEARQAKYAARYKDVLPAAIQYSIFQEELPTYYFVSGFSHPELPIVKQDGIFLFEWGLIPSWAKDEESANEIRTKTLNAVGETVFEKPSFKKGISTQRCLLGIAGFYEWRDCNKVKYPYFIKVKNTEIFSLGCIFDSWIDRNTGEVRNTFSILTTPANPLMEGIHNLKKRMPLILSQQDEKKWIDPELNTSEIISLIKPYNETELAAYTVSKNVNSSRNNRNIPESLAPFEYSDLAPLE